jgi:hypothetical protein
VCGIKYFLGGGVVAGGRHRGCGDVGVGTTSCEECGQSAQASIVSLASSRGLRARLDCPHQYDQRE